MIFVESVGNHIQHPFASKETFLDLLISSDKEKKHLLDNILQEVYYLSKNTHNSIHDIDEITYYERSTLLNILLHEQQKEQEVMQKIRTAKKG